ncbi:MAG: glycosyltransferase [Verrucomicrobia bacterium]|nr:glycosyltransferase [Verrucomicrobiota bacterium]
MSFLSLLFGILGSLLAALTIISCVRIRWVRRLPTFNQLSADSSHLRSKAEGQVELPKVSVVLASRDEGQRLENTLRRLLSQRGINLELIVVNDRSQDGTKDVLERLRAQDHRVHPIHVTQLPAGWLGKCHACHLGAGRATGDWILFTDADCWLAEDVIARSVLAARAEKVEHVVLAPGMETEGFFTRPLHSSFALVFSHYFARVNRDDPITYIGAGAFNLVRRELYQRCGGYDRLRLTVVDDVKLGQLIRRAGGRTRAFLGSADAVCHWGTSIRGLIHNLEKNHFALTDYRVSHVIGAVLGTGLIYTGVLAGPFSGTWAGWAALIAFQSLGIPAGILARRLGWSVWNGVLAPWTFPILTASLLNSTWVTLRRGGVTWRDTFYPLEQLRENNVR